MSQDGRVNSPESAGPHWLAQLLRTRRDPIPWGRVSRAPLALGAPFAIALAMNNIGVGALAATGVLPTVLADADGPYAYRARRLLGVTALAGLGYIIGLLVGGTPALSAPVIVLVAGASMLISAAGNNASVASLQLFVFTVLGTGQHLSGVAPGKSLLWFLVGVAWGLLVALVGWTVRAVSPERNAVAQVFIELAGMLSAADEATQHAARHQLTTALNTAYDRLLTARSWLSGRDATYRGLLTLLSSATPTVEAAVAMVNAGRPAPRDVVDYLTDVATAVHAGVEPPAPPDQHGDVELAPLYSGLDRLGERKERARRERLGPVGRVRAWLTTLASGPLTWLAALRLSLCVAIAEVTSLLLPLERSYWITLTVGIVLKPDFGSVFGRAVLRGAGTLVGVGIGAAVLGLGAHGWGLVLFVGVFAVGVAVGKVRNYAILSAFVTPLIIVQMDLSVGGNWTVVTARLIDTAIGCLIVLVFGYLLWPGSMRPRVGGRLADTVGTVREYLAKALRPANTAEQRQERARARRRAYRALADLRTAFQQVVVEPSAAGRQASTWWPVIVALERATDAITAVSVAVEHDALDADPPPTADVDLLTTAMTELSAAVTEQRDPADVDLPDNEQLADITEQIEATFDAVRGPDLTNSAALRLLRRFLRVRRQH